MKKKIIVILSILLVVVTVVIINRVAAGKNQAENYDTAVLSTRTIYDAVSASGTIESERYRNVVATNGLEVLSVSVANGDVVQEGDVLAVLDSSDLERDLKQAELNVKNAQNSLTEAQKANGQSIDSAQISLDSANLELKNAQNNLSKLNKDVSLELAVKNAKLDLEKAQTTYQDQLAQNGQTVSILTAKIDLDNAVTKYEDLLTSGVNTSSVDLAQIDYNSAKAAYDRAVDAREAGLEPLESSLKIAKDALKVLSEGDAGYTAAVLSRNQAEQAYNSAKNTYENTIAQAETTKDKAKIALDNAKKSATDALDAAKSARDKAQLAYDNAVKASSDGLITAKSALDKAQVAYDMAIKNANDAYTAAEYSLERNEINKRTAENTWNVANSKNVTANTLAIELQRVAVEKLKKQQSLAVIRAPIGGTVTYVGIKEGDRANGIVFVMENTNSLKVVTDVGEFDIASISLGQEVSIKTDATGDQEFTGEVTAISPTTEKSAVATGAITGGNRFAVEIGINGIDEQLKVGMNARVNIINQSRKNVYAVPSDALVKSDDGSYGIYIVKDGTPKLVTVTPGIESDVFTEISGNGLVEGASYVTNPAEMNMSQRERMRMQMTGE